ncbi:tyrosine-type recombinase/integrase [Sphingobium phenoxybenzoativorans]|uniref:tyrosine-type recombinase/integrase n=1 Tax=Sphingobium phenoxybenzoativorans TaxID=1592790 RepID=UPI0008722C6B|nr:site-specific integrase [Sphingobium phenoxybenzoativorans]
MSIRFQKLTRPAIKSLASGAKITEHGITAEKLANGDVRYSVNVMVDGARIHRALGTASAGVTREQAERFIEAARTKAREDRLDLPKGRKAHRSFKDAAKAYLERLEATGGKNIGDKRRHLDDRLVPHFGALRADKLTEFGVQSYAKKRLDAGFKQATVNRELATLSHMMNRLVDWKWIKKDDRPRIAKGEEPRKPIVVMSDIHIEALMTAALKDHDDRLWLFVAFGLNTAMRHSEIVATRYDQIDFESRRIFIPLAKAGEREQPITPTLADALKIQREKEDDKCGYIFPPSRPSKYLHRQSMGKQFLRAVINAGLSPQKVTPHVMRHTAITRLVKAKIDLPTIQRISGHKTLAMVLRYVHIHGNHIDEAIARIDTGMAAALHQSYTNPPSVGSPRECSSLSY